MPRNSAGSAVSSTTDPGRPEQAYATTHPWFVPICKMAASVPPPSRGGDDPHLIPIYFQYGRYMLIASSRPGTLAANLQGIWNESVDPPWSSKYTININTQMNYWLANRANLADLHAPLFDLLESTQQASATTAHKYSPAATRLLARNGHTPPSKARTKYTDEPLVPTNEAG